MTQFDATKHVYRLTTCTFGCDPEFFFTREGQIIGAEKVLARTPIHRFVIDGVQVELNPTPDSCRARLGNQIRAHFQALQARLQGLDKISASFTPVVEVSKEEMDSLSDSAKVFGCAPSFNYYEGKESTISVDPRVYLKRSAGGHIHLGLGGTTIQTEAKDLIPILDAVVGNTCVLIDRDPNQAERRKVYGRAGEYRLPSHGLEYRTLSNFWLRAYPLFSMVMGLARQCVYIQGHSAWYRTATEAQKAYIRPYYQTSFEWDPRKELLAAVDLGKVRTAINTNDPKLAWETWEVVRDFFSAHFEANGLTLDRGNVKQFNSFLKVIQEKGINHYWKDDPLTHWCNLTDGHYCGFETFLGKHPLK